jgi:hypothetical protein
MTIDPDRLDDEEKRLTASMAMAIGVFLLAAAIVLPGPVALPIGLLGGTLFGMALPRAFHAGTADDGNPPKAWPPQARAETAAGPQPAMVLEADAATPVPSWRDRVADAPAAGRSR